MAKLTKDDVFKLARLAKLHLSESEAADLQSEIAEILGYVEQLQGIDLGDVEPTSQVSGLKNVMRPDRVRDYGVSPDELLKNAPASESGHIKVKRILG